MHGKEPKSNQLTKCMSKEPKSHQLTKCMSKEPKPYKLTQCISKNWKHNDYACTIKPKDKLTKQWKPQVLAKMIFCKALMKKGDILCP